MATPAGPVAISEAARRHLRLHLAEDVGPVRLRKLIERFGSLDAVESASVAALTRVEGVGQKTAEKIVQARSDDRVEREIARASQYGLSILCGEDEAYPKPLLHIADPPVCLYVRGTLAPNDAVAVAIVGTRRCSHYGREQALRFGESLAAAGFTIVSGLARGIDAYAHQGALRAGGRTIAVLGNGLGSIYPPEHGDLAVQIAAHGAIVSELPVDTAPEAGNFPKRNRIIAGLSLGVMVIEAGLRSGALITARLALEYNREVFAVPGRVDRPELTAGVNGLIRDGQGKLVTCLEDVIDELQEVAGAMRPAKAVERAEVEAIAAPAVSSGLPDRATPDERAVFAAVADGAEDIEAISATTGLEAPRVLSILMTLELRKVIRRLPGDRFECRRAKDQPDRVVTASDGS